MSLFPILIIALVIISTFASADKKKKAEEARRRQAEQHRANTGAAQPAPDPRFYDVPQAQRPAQRPPDPRFYDTQPAQRPAQPAPDPRFYDVPQAQRPAQRPPDPRFYDTQPAQRPAPKPANAYTPISGGHGGSMVYASSEGMQGASTEGMLGSSVEGTGLRPTMAKPARSSMQSRVAHTVKPVTESAHAHEETSITGIDPDCHAEAYSPPDEQSAQAARSAVLRFDRTSVTEGLIYAEILGKPKALRHAR